MAEIQRFDPTIKIPSSRGNRFAHGPNVGQALTNLGQSMQQLDHKIQEVEREKQKARDMNEAFGILQEAELGVEEDMVALRREGLDSGAFRTRGDEAIRTRNKVATEKIGKLADERVRTHATGQLGVAMHRRTLGLVDETDKRFVDEDRATTVARVEGLKNLAINAPDDVGYAMYTQQLKDYLLGGESADGTVILPGKAGRTMTREAAEAQLLKDNKEIAVERLKLQVKRYPERVDEVLAGAAGRDLQDHEKEGVREFADQVIRKRLERDNQIMAAAKQQYAAQAENVEIAVQSMVRKRQITKDGIEEFALRHKGPDGAPIFTAERVATFQKMLDDTRKFESDDSTMKRLGLAIQSATTEGELTNILGQVDAAYRSDLINEADWDKLSARSRAYATHFRDTIKSSHKTAHDEVLDELKAMFRITPFMQSKMFDERSQAYEASLRELNKASVTRGGEFYPREWWDGNRHRIAARVRDVIDKQIDVRMQDLPVDLRESWKPGETPDQNIMDRATLLLDAKKKDMHPEQFERHRRTIREIRGMVGEHNRAFGISQKKPAGTTNTLGR